MAAPKKGQKRKKAAAAAPSSATARVGLRSGGNAQRHASTGESDEGEAWTQLSEAWRSERALAQAQAGKEADGG